VRSTETAGLGSLRTGKRGPSGIAQHIAQNVCFMNPPILPSVLIELPFPPASLSGHSDKHFWRMRPIIKKHREWAIKAALAVRSQVSLPLADNSDIRISVTFYPPNRRGDRVNFPNRMKPYWDGIADALCVNDSRFLPSYHFAEPVKNPRVVVRIG
jgi:hypothetical protein